MSYDDEADGNRGLSMSNSPPEDMSVFNALEDCKEYVWDRAEEYMS